MNIISLINIGYSFKHPLLPWRKQKPILKELNLDITPNSIIGIIGESGCGKTTLAKIITGVLNPTSGSIEKKEDTNIQLLFQNSEDLIHPFRKVKNILSDVSQSDEDTAKICSLLGIESKLLNQKGISLSGGERQRVGIARILLNKPDLMILDEPFSAQDPDSRRNLSMLLKKINQKYGTALLIISHNLEPLRNLVSNIFVMYDGKIVEQGAFEKIVYKPLHPYTQFLMKAEEYKLTRNDLIRSNSPDGSNCSFYGLCKNKSEACKGEIKCQRLDDRCVVCNNYLI